MSIRTSNQVGHHCNRLTAITTTAPTNLKRKDAHGRVGVDKIASLVTSTAITVKCFYWHEATGTFIAAGPDTATHTVAFDAGSSYAWSVPEDAYVYFQITAGSNCNVYTDLCAPASV